MQANLFKTLFLIFFTKFLGQLLLTSTKHTSEITLGSRNWILE